MTDRPSRRHCNVIMSRALHGYNEDQLARFIGVNRETMRGWAKLDKDFAEALDIARRLSSEFWEKMDDEVQRRNSRDWQNQHFSRTYGRQRSKKASSAERQN
jgi:DNA-binding XRE family transcriptional regulator